MVLTPNAKRRRTSNIQRTTADGGAYEVEEILGYKLVERGLELRFLVKWKGFNADREFSLF